MRVLLILFLTAFLAACGSSAGVAQPPAGNAGGVETGPFRALVYSRTAGFRHASIEAGIQAIQSLGAANDFSVDASEDPAVFTPENLAQYRVVIFLNTTLNVLDTDAQQQALQNFITSGGGYVGVHSAADTEHDWPWYGELVGAYFRSHPVQQIAQFRVEAADHPSVSPLPNPWTVFDEFYSFRSNPRGQVRVLLNIDESGYSPNPNTSCLPDSATFPNGYDGVMGDHPMSWCHDNLGGRAWYTALGHEVAMYQLPEYSTHLLNGILTAAKRLAADCTPREAAAPSQPPQDLRMCPVA